MPVEPEAHAWTKFETPTQPHIDDFEDNSRIGSRKTRRYKLFKEIDNKWYKQMKGRADRWKKESKMNPHERRRVEFERVRKKMWWQKKNQQRREGRSGEGGDSGEGRVDRGEGRFGGEGWVGRGEGGKGFREGGDGVAYQNRGSSKFKNNGRMHRDGDQQRISGNGFGFETANAWK